MELVSVKEQAQVYKLRYGVIEGARRAFNSFQVSGLTYWRDVAGIIHANGLNRKARRKARVQTLAKGLTQSAPKKAE